MAGIHCPRCQARHDPSLDAIVAHVVDGPGLQFRVVLEEESEPGDVRVRCEHCHSFYFVRTWKSAA